MATKINKIVGVTGLFIASLGFNRGFRHYYNNLNTKQNITYTEGFYCCFSGVIGASVYLIPTFTPYAITCEIKELKNKISGNEEVIENELFHNWSKNNEIV
jgi:hypothetical protein